MTPFDPAEALSFNLEQISLLVAEIDVPVLGFVGAPFTLCSYLVDPPRSRDLAEIKAFMWRSPDAWHELAGFWADHMAAFGIAQHKAGAGAVQVFDSWAGALGVEDYREFALPHTQRLLRRMKEAHVPTIHFSIGNPALLPLIAEAGGDAISVDWRLPIDEAWAVIGHDRAIQGNLDPTVLLAGKDIALKRTREILDRVAGRPGHIFNLGHGLLPETDHTVVRAVTDFVHEYTARNG
jgi:uroporphyrinogen decarboxylase